MQNQYRSAETIRLLAYLLFVGYVALVIACFNSAKPGHGTPQTTIHASSKPTSQGNGPEIQIITERGVLTNR